MHDRADEFASLLRCMPLDELTELEAIITEAAADGVHVDEFQIGFALLRSRLVRTPVLPGRYPEGDEPSGGAATNRNPKPTRSMWRSVRPSKPSPRPA